MTNLAEELWLHLRTHLEEFAKKVTMADSSLIYNIGKTTNKAFLLRGYLSLMKRSDGNEVAITVDVQTDDDLLTVVSDVCTDDGATYGVSSNITTLQHLNVVMLELTPLFFSNAAKTITGTQRFSAFGQTLTTTGTTIPSYGYTGREPDASGLIYYRARYYDPNQIRFTQRDPIGFKDGINPYLYVHNNPVSNTDPSGLSVQTISNYLTSGLSYYSTSNSGNYVSNATSSYLSQGLTTSSGGSLANVISWSNYQNQSSSEQGSLASSATNVLGKIWNAPNTVVGLVVGGLGTVLGGDLPVIGNNAIQFINNPLLSNNGAITLGNVINYGQNNPPTNILPNNSTTAQHEQQHTLQGEQLGPLYLPSNILGGITGEISDREWGMNPSTSNWNESGPTSTPPTKW